MTGELDRVLPGATHDDVFLDLACGLRAVIARFDDLLARFAPPRDGAPARDPGDAGIVDLALGVIALRDRIVQTTAVPAGIAASTSSTVAPCDGSLLR